MPLRELRLPIEIQHESGPFRGGHHAEIPDRCRKEGSWGDSCGLFSRARGGTSLVPLVDGFCRVGGGWIEAGQEICDSHEAGHEKEADDALCEESLRSHGLQDNTQTMSQMGWRLSRGRGLRARLLKPIDSGRSGR